MLLLCRALAALLGLILLVAVAIAGLAAAVFSIQGDIGTLSLTKLCDLVELDRLRGTVGAWLAALEDDGPTATVAALAGVGAVLLGLALLIGSLVGRRERLVLIERSPRGQLAARRRAAGQALRALAEQPRDVIAAKVRVRARRRRRGGRARLTLLRAQTAERRAVLASGKERAQPLAEAMALRVRARQKVPRRHGRVR